MTETIDLTVIGVGIARINAAKMAARTGWSVAIMDELPYGGTCALRGCDPKKMLRAGPRLSTPRGCSKTTSRSSKLCCVGSKLVAGA